MHSGVLSSFQQERPQKPSSSLWVMHCQNRNNSLQLCVLPHWIYIKLQCWSMRSGAWVYFHFSRIWLLPAPAFQHIWLFLHAPPPHVCRHVHVSARNQMYVAFSQTGKKNQSSSHAVIHRHISQWWCNMTDSSALYSTDRSMIHLADGLKAWQCIWHTSHPATSFQWVSDLSNSWLHGVSYPCTSISLLTWLF